MNWQIVCKLLGGLLISCGGFLLGGRAVGRMKKRVRDMQELRRVLHYLRAEIEYTAAPLQIAFQHIAGKGREPYATWLGTLAGKMQERQGRSFEALWEASLAEMMNHSGLTKKELSLLLDLGQSLGYLDVKQQLGGIDLCDALLGQELSQLGNSLQERTKTVWSICTLGGLMLVLILL